VRGSVRNLVQVTGSEETQRFGVLMVGQSMTLKTTYLMSWPDPLIEYWDPNDATLRKESGVKHIMHPTIEEHEHEFLPKVQNREYDCETIGLDSFSFFADTYLKHLKGGKDKLDIAQWGILLDRLDRTLKILLSAKQPHPRDPSKRTYHIVVTCHEKDVYDSDGNLIKFSPAIDGQFKDRIARYFDTVLLTGMDMVNVPTKRDGRTVYTKEPEFFVLTTPTDKYRVAGDRIGGGRYNRLPHRMGGTYPELCEAWGIKQ
jgi:hypothetical protein